MSLIILSFPRLRIVPPASAPNETPLADTTGDGEWWGGGGNNEKINSDDSIVLWSSELSDDWGSQCKPSCEPAMSQRVGAHTSRMCT